MTKVKILSSNYNDILEQMINEFISTHHVLDVQFSTARAVVYSAMITYEED
jgi:hypothetical protein